MMSLFSSKASKKIVKVINTSEKVHKIYVLTLLNRELGCSPYMF